MSVLYGLVCTLFTLTELEVFAYDLNSIRMVKATIPADRRWDIQLDRDGLGWDDICDFLEVPRPEKEYPDRNEPARFQALFEKVIGPWVLSAALRCGVVLVVGLGVAVWAGMKYGSPFAAVKEYYGV